MPLITCGIHKIKGKDAVIICYFIMLFYYVILLCYFYYFPRNPFIIKGPGSSFLDTPCIADAPRPNIFIIL
jgi:hypothetical protein